MTTPFPFVAGQVLTAAQLNDIQNLPISDKTASYTLLVGDVTKRTIMNAAGATTITVDDAIFTVGDVIQVANKGAGTCTITAGAGVTINTSGSLDLAQYGGGYLLAISASSFFFFNLGVSGVGYGTATGGIGAPTAVTIDGVDYEYLTFNATGTLTIVSPGLFDVCLVGAGGGSAGGNNTSYRGGGGGGGEIVQQTIYLTANATVTIGAGGAGGTAGISPGYIGFSSVLGSGLSHVSATGGGGAPINDSSPTLSAAGNGACGAGGVGISAGAGAGLAFVDGTTGKNGGTGTSNGAGGGGGNTGAGSNGVSGTGGAGGAGTDISAFVGSSVTRAGGGGGSGSTGGSGGAGGGGAGGSGAAGTAGTVNTGGGGGGGSTGGGGAAGGSGNAYIRYEV
jgi:hypothetical protein